MARIMAIDYGIKRTGIAVTDPLQIIATGLTTIATPGLIDFLTGYIQKEELEKIIIGYPVNLDDSDTHATKAVQHIIKKIRSTFPHLPVIEVDERFTSKMAKQAMIDMGLRKKQRRQKSTVDKIAATIILQEYLHHSLP
ncbi:MAG: Holliday junction resolvase RuvX [Chitinophagaceae bacterium]|nr:Holliday junction resolvase RuvX [Chitinophagaceae bacterium]